MTDLRDLLASSFGDGPPYPPTEDHVARGRRVLRRRRALAGSGAALAVAAVVTTTALAAGPDPGRASLTPAGPPTPTATAATAPPPTPTEQQDQADLAACLSALAGLVDLEPEALERLELTYDPDTGQIVLPRDPVSASIAVDGGLETLECEIDGVPVTVVPETRTRR